MNRVFDWTLEHKALMVVIVVPVIMTVGTFLFFTVDGTEVNEGVQAVAYQPTAISETPECISKQDTLYNLTLPLQQQENNIDNQLNSIGQMLSTYKEPGNTESIDSLASRDSPATLSHVQDLESQYITTDQKISSLQAQYSC